MSASITDLIAPLQPFAQQLVNLAGRAGVQPRVTSTLRTRSQQERLYRAFLRGETHYPVAPPGSSAHEFGYAFDMVADTPENLHDLGSIWVQWGGEWSPNDEVHFQYPGFVTPEPAINFPSSGIVARAAEAYADIPWYISILTPTVTSVAHGTLAEASRGSPGARFMCNLGFKNFC